jgi:hypothetical protein
MPRVFYGNFDFEHELTTPAYNCSARLERLNAESTSHLLALADDGDHLFYPCEAPIDFLKAASRANFPDVRVQVPNGRMIDDLTMTPWGWSKRVSGFAKSRGWASESPAADAVAAANLRQFSFLSEQRCESAIPGTAEVDSLESLSVAIRAAADLWNCQVTALRWFVKAEFSMSGRERISGCGSDLDESRVNWIRRRLKMGERIYFEPRVDALCELSTQWNVERAASDDGRLREPELFGTTQLLTDRSGQYLGSVFVDDSTLKTHAISDPDFSLSKEMHSQVLSDTRSVAVDVQQLGYYGPLGIDAMFYRGPGNAPMLRTVQDVNARFTMGRIAVEWIRRFSDSDRPAWLLVPLEWLNDGVESASLTNTARRLTSPRVVAGQAVRRVGVLISEAAQWKKLLAAHLRP